VNTWKIILATIVIFGAGVVTGGLLVGYADRGKLKQPRPRMTMPQPGQLAPPLRDFPRRPEQELQRSLEQRRMEFLLNASRELKLSSEQRERLERLIGESQERTRQLWERVGPQMRRELAEVKEKIREELTPQQRKRFEELMKRQQARRPAPAREVPPSDGTPQQPPPQAPPPGSPGNP
jgi:hypothetical protein